MTERDWETLEKYVRVVADAIELRDWVIEVERRPCEDSAYATVYATYGRKVADIRFVENFRTLDAAVQRHAVVHELVHLHVEAAANMVRVDLESILGQQSDLIFWNGFKRQIEYGVDSLASALAKHMPMITWPRDEAA